MTKQSIIYHDGKVARHIKQFTSQCKVMNTSLLKRSNAYKLCFTALTLSYVQQTKAQLIDILYF